MKIRNQSGSTVLNILLVIMFIIIAILIYILAGGKTPTTKRVTGTQSPNIITSEKETNQNTDTFSDGLSKPVFSEKYKLDEMGSGISERDIFDIDINGDGLVDRITRTKNENGTSHFYYEYIIELNKNGKFVNITPDGFRTTEGAECSLQKLRFNFKPEFRVEKISRDWSQSWDTPTMATKTTYIFNDGNLKQTESIPLKIICDVKNLF